MTRTHPPAALTPAFAVAAAAAAPPAIGVGSHIGPYLLLRSLGRGGMAEVFLARHRHLGQLRALKLLAPEIWSIPALADRLLTEARATFQLAHPAIVQVLDCDVLDRGGAFLVMEYLEGETLARWLARVGPLARRPRLAAAMVGVVAEGLAHAHGQGIVHRDLKPDNLFLIRDPAVPARFSLKVMDFGVAKLMREVPLTKTRTGCLVGTPPYMAPEQCVSAAPVDERADVYALGCVLFEVLCGRPPFVAQDLWGVLAAHVTVPAPAVRSIQPAVPEALEHLVARMLAKTPEERPQSMQEVLAELEAFLGCAQSEFAGLLSVPEGRLQVEVAQDAPDTTSVRARKTRQRRRRSARPAPRLMAMALGLAAFLGRVPRPEPPALAKVESAAAATRTARPLRPGASVTLAVPAGPPLTVRD